MLKQHFEIVADPNGKVLARVELGKIHKPNIKQQVRHVVR